MRYVTGVVILIAASMACSRGNERAVASSPTSPTSAMTTGVTTIAYVGGVSGPMDVLFPGRNESFLFRQDLETKYATSLGRAAVGLYTDREGEVVWLQEYIRYRVNGCDHATAVARVLTQIDGGAAGGVCAAPPEGVILFPPRTDIFDARRLLELKYQQMGRGLSPTSVDPEGSAVWITEYLRYRTNSCGHAEAEAKVFTQIDGGPVPPLCTPPCAYVLNPGGINSGPGGSTQSFEVRPNPTGGCVWTARSTVPWVTIATGFDTGSTFTVVPYTIGTNNGGDRTGHIDVAWQGGGQRYVVNQSGSAFGAAFTMTDSFRAGSATVTECHIRSTSTPCVLTASENLPGGGAHTYSWSASYFYGTQKTTTQLGSSNVFTVTDGCGGTGATAAGAGTDLIITLTITDSLGNTITLRSGEGSQPALALMLFNC